MDQTNVGNMNGFYDRPYSPEELQRLADMNSHGAIMDVAGSNTIDMSGMMGGQSLDDIINQNNKDFQRRRIFHHSSSYGSLNNRHLQEHDSRRSSMLEFGSQNNSDLEGYQFDPSPTPMPSNMVMQCPGNIAQRRLDNQRAKRQSSNEELVLDTNFSSMAPNYTPMSSSSPYGHNLNSSDSLTFDMSSNYITNDMLMGMDYHSSGMDQGTNGDITPRNAFGQPNFAAGLNSSPMQQHMAGSMSGQMHDPGGGNAGSLGTREMIEKLPNMQVSDEMQNPQVDLSQPPMSAADATATAQMPPPNGLPNYSNQAPQPTPNLDITTSAEGLPYEGQNNAGQQVIPQYRNAYSSSGFDMLGVLMRVAARPNPQINIGAVDMSCAFVVCDATKHDIPIVYCSDVFERLTAYTKHEILGRNCRFLQGPDGKIQAGIKRKYVDDQSVLRIKTMITKRQESQVSLINYRKGGQPFMNLLTMIPITWDSDEIKYYVGFQVDLVEQPTSITNKNSDGSYSVSYQRGLLPRYVIPENHSQRDSELGQTVARDDVSTVLSTIGAGESELSKRIWDKVLLENTDDVVHVLSLKGLFLYLSPSSRKVLEYDPSELVGTALSSVCHPSDIVPVTRELKDTSTGAAVNVVFRIRRKHSGYTWFESHGSLHLEQGKGRKCIIMVGRERPVYALARNDILSVGGFGESELWTKMSTSGMFLFVSSNVRSILDRQPDDLFGTSAQALMRADSKLEFGRQLELACTGIRVTFKHDVQNKRGQTLQARTTIYPGDACEGQKPTFLVAQTRLLKPPRTLNRQPSNISPKAEPKSTSPASSAGGVSGGNKTPQSASGNVKLENITTQAGGSGLIIGNQHEALASEENVFDELKTTRSTSWQYELRQMEKRNRLLAEELQSLLSRKKKRKRRNGAGQLQKDCANCHTRVTPEWRRGPSGNRDLCNSCGLRWAKENGRVTPRTSSQKSDRESGASASPARTNAYNSVSGVDQNADPESVKANQQRSPQSLNTDSHNAKMARMEATASHGYAGGIPAKIEEGVETSM